MSLPIFQTQERILSQMQTQWSSQLNPLLSCPLVNGRLIESITLTTGSNTINHRLSRNLVGYIVCLKSADVTIYDTQATNAMTDKTLRLTASGPAVITLWVF